MKNIFKSVVAILAGFVAAGVLSVATDALLEKLGLFPPANPQLYAQWMLALALVYRSLYTAGGGFIAAKLAPDRPLGHAITLGTIGCVVALLASLANWDKTIPSTAWYPILLVIMSLPSAWLGGEIAG